MARRQAGIVQHWSRQLQPPHLRALKRNQGKVAAQAGKTLHDKCVYMTQISSNDPRLNQPNQSATKCEINGQLRGQTNAKQMTTNLQLRGQPQQGNKWATQRQSTTQSPTLAPLTNQQMDNSEGNKMESTLL